METDPATMIKRQLGELIWANCCLQAEVEKLSKQIEAMRAAPKDNENAR